MKIEDRKINSKSPSQPSRRVENYSIKRTPQNNNVHTKRTVKSTQANKIKAPLREETKAQKILRIKREKEKARKKKQRKVRIMMAFLMLFLIAGVMASIYFLFKIQDYRVEGESIYSQEEIISAFGYEIDENMFSFSMSETEQSIMEKLPYVETVKVRRSLPGTVVIKITPAIEEYCIESNDEWCVVSSGFKILKNVSQKSNNLMTIYGMNLKDAFTGNILLEEDEEKLESIKEFLSLIENETLGDISEVHFEDMYDIWFIYDNRFEVVLGTMVGVQTKLDSLSTIVDTQLGPEDTGRIDLTNSASKGAKTTVRYGSLDSFLQERNADDSKEIETENVETETPEN